jgi:hypothetical protein
MPEGKAKRARETGGAIQVERRAWVRYDSSLSASCQPTGTLKDAGWAAQVRDISLGGLGLLLQHRFRPGTPLLVELKNAAGEVLRTVPVRVAHATPFLRGNNPCWLLGCQFVHPLTDAELKSLL